MSTSRSEPGLSFADPPEPGPSRYLSPGLHTHVAASSSSPNTPIVTPYPPQPRGEEDDEKWDFNCLLLPPGCDEESECTIPFCPEPSSFSIGWPIGPPTGTNTGTTGEVKTTTHGTSYYTTTSPMYSASESPSPSSSYDAVGTSVPAETSNANVTTHLTAVQIAGITIGSVLGAILLGLFFWLLRRGTFGSGTLFGLRYGAARLPGWRPDGGLGHTGTEMRQERRRKGGVLVTPFDPLNSIDTSLPSYPSSTLTVSVESAQPFLQHAKLHPRTPSISSDSHTPLPPSRTPIAWSTSPSAFDNAYGSIVASSTTGSSSRAAPSDATSMSEVSTLVSDATGRSFPSTSAVLSYTPSLPPSSYPNSHPQPNSHPNSLPLAYPLPHPHPQSQPQPHPRWEGMMAAPTSLPTSLPTRGESPAPTVSTSTGAEAESERSASSTIEGVRISSWHSSDSEEAELIGRGRGLGLPRR